MEFKIEVLYTYGWDDARWTEEGPDGVTKPLRFKSTDSAQEGLNDYFLEVRKAVAVGNLEKEENPNHYRIVPLN
jgi:hypothetical protein